VIVGFHEGIRERPAAGGYGANPVEPQRTTLAPTTTTSRPAPAATTSWAVVAPFFDQYLPNGALDARWLDDFVTADHHRFVKVPASGDAGRSHWHRRATRRTPGNLWLQYWNQGGNAFAGTDGVIAVFPQLAATVGLRKAIRRQDHPVVAWCFNVGSPPPRAILPVARRAMRSIDRFVVHARAEVAVVSEWFDLPPERVEFVHLQRAPIPVLAAEETERPFVVALGSAHRDYALMFRALERTGIPAVVVASDRALKGLTVPPNVTVRSDLTADECHRIAQRARFSLVPLDDVPIAAGQVTVIESMRMGRPVIATRGTGTVDYIDHEVDGLLVDPQDGRGFANAIMRLWEDEPLRTRLAANALRFADTTLSDEAAGRSLTRILDDVLGAPAPAAVPASSGNL
jgi:hypothetical protein